MNSKLLNLRQQEIIDEEFQKQNFSWIRSGTISTHWRLISLQTLFKIQPLNHIVNLSKPRGKSQRTTYNCKKY